MPKGSEPRNYYSNLKIKKRKVDEVIASKSSSSKERVAAIDDYVSTIKRGQEGRKYTVPVKKKRLDATSFGGLDYQMKKKAEKAKSGRVALTPIKKTVRPATSAKKGK